VLSVAPVDDASVALDEALQEPPSLEDYLAQEHTMGPVVPDGIDLAGLPVSSTDGADDGGSAVDQYFDALFDGAEGEDECEEDCGDPPPEDPPPEDPPPEDPPPDEPPTGDASDPEQQSDGSVIVNGSISDDGGLENVSIGVDGIPDATVTINEDGSFSIDIPPGQEPGDITIIVTDANGNQTTITVSLPG